MVSMPVMAGGPVDISDDMIGVWDDNYANDCATTVGACDYVDMTSSESGSLYVDMTSPEDVDENIYEDIATVSDMQRPTDRTKKKKGPPRPRPPSTAQSRDTGDVTTCDDVEVPICATATNYTYSMRQLENGLEEEDYGIDTDGTQTVLVRALTDIQRADHVAWRRAAGVWHHAIVVDVDTVLAKLQVLHYNGAARRPEGEKDWASIRHERVGVKLQRKDFYHVIYDPTIVHCYSAHIVLERAFSRLGEAKYNPFTNNCEHFARWCKTGQARSVQLENLPQRVRSATDEFVDKVNNIQSNSSNWSPNLTQVDKLAHKTGHIIGRKVKSAVGRVATSQTGLQMAERVKVASDRGEELIDGLVDKFHVFNKWQHKN